MKITFNGPCRIKMERLYPDSISAEEPVAAGRYQVATTALAFKWLFVPNN